MFQIRMDGQDYPDNTGPVSSKTVLFLLEKQPFGFQAQHTNSRSSGKLGVENHWPWNSLLSEHTVGANQSSHPGFKPWRFRLRRVCALPSRYPAHSVWPELLDQACSGVVFSDSKPYSIASMEDTVSVHWEWSPKRSQSSKNIISPANY